MKKLGLLLATMVVVAAVCICLHNRLQNTSRGAAAARRTVGKTTSNIKRVAENFGRLPVSFEENRGQSDPRVKFLSRGPTYGLFVSGSEATIVHHAKMHLRDGDLSTALQSFGSQDVRTSSTVRLSWMGANARAQAVGMEQQPGTTNYLIGKDSSKWRRNVPHYGSVGFRGLYPGIDLIYHGKEQKLEFDYVVAPKANPAAIRVGISGPSLVNVDGEGGLSISSAGDQLTLLKPVAYQEEKDGRRSLVEAKYVLTASHEFGFQVGAYDGTRPLIIDPVLDFAANFGNDLAADVVLDSQGNMYITGTTCETDFPTTSGAFQKTGGNNLSSACNKAIVTKLDATASTLIYSTYIGGSGVEFATRLLVDPAGEATVVGTTTSIDFPTTAGVFQPLAKGGTCTYGPFLQNQACSDAFLLKLKADGSGLIYSTLFGGERAEIAIALTQDAAGNSYIAGATDSTLLPVNTSVATGSFQKTYGGQGDCQQGAAPCFDGFIAKFSPDGTQLLASTYLGGDDDDFVTALAIDKTTGNLYAVGSADSTNFPTTAGSLQPVHAGTVDQRDVFLSRLDPTLHTLQYSTFLGGANDDIATNVKIDAAGAAYITGSTISANFPVTDGSTYKGPDPANTTCGSTLDGGVIDGQPDCGDIFLAKIDPSKPVAAQQLIFSKLLGGSSNDYAYNLALDSQGNIWLAGATNSSDFFYTSDAYYTAQGPLLMEIKSDGSQVLFSTGLSPFGGRLALALNIDANDNVYVAGEGTVSPTPGAYADPAGTIFVMKFSQGTGRPAVTLSATSIDFSKDPVSGAATNGTPTNAAIGPRSVTLTNSGTAALHLAISLAAPQQGAQFFSESDNCPTTLASAASCTISAVYLPDSTSSGIDGGTIVISSDAPGSPASVILSGRNGLVESASFVPATLSFPNQAPGTSSGSQMSNFDNPATTQTSIFARPTAAPVIGGTNAADFHVDTSNCVVGTAFCSLTVTFTPAASASGTRTATVTLASNAPNSPSVLNLTGTVSSGPAGVIVGPSITAATVGVPSNQFLLIKNTGGSALNVTSVVVSGPNASDFVLSNESCGFPAFTLPPQTPTTAPACDLSIAITPGAHGIRTATFTLADNETVPASTTVSYYAADSGGPQLFLSSPAVAINGVGTFGDTVVGRTTIFEQSILTLFNFANAGPNSGAHITNVSLTGDFVQTNTCQTPSNLLTGGNNCGFVVEFAPKTAGPHSGTLTVTTDAPGAPVFTANFFGNGVTIPTAQMAPTALNFGKQEMGSTTTTALTTTLKNTGNGPLNLSNIAVSGPFTQTNTCSNPLLPAATCVFSVKFAPAATGPASGTLSFASNSAGGTTIVGLSGIGVTGATPVLQPTSLIFGNQGIGSTSAAQNVTLSNVGNAAFNFNGITVGENFTANGTGCPATLAAGASCTLKIAFAPTTDTFVGGTTGGAAFVSLNTPGSPLKISLTGTPTASTGAATTDAITSAPNPSTFGQAVTITATVTSQTAGTITGTVTFFDGSNQIGAPVAVGAQGKATLVTSSLSVGTHGLSFQYSGDANFAPSNSSGVGQVVNAAAAAATTTAITSTLNPSTVGASVTFNVQVSSQSSGPLTGTASLMDGATLLGGASVGSDGRAAFSTSALTQGSHSITAIYNGNTNFLTSTSPALTQVVNAAAAAATSTVVASSLNPSTVGASVTFTATVTSQTPGAIAGTVTFSDGATSLGTGTVGAGGVATLTTSALAPGNHAITAAYGGNATFAASTSAALTQTVNAAPTATALVSSLNPSTVGASVTFTATVTSQLAGAIGGSVTFKDGATSIGTGTVGAGGVATIAITTLAQGTHSITAVYGASGNFAASTSAALTQTVNAAPVKTPTVTTLASSLNPSNVGASVTFTATLNTQAAVVPAEKAKPQTSGAITGTVTFFDGATNIGTGTLAGGSTTFMTSTLAAGAHSITAQYGGDANFAASTSAALTQTVNAPDFSVAANPTSLTLTAGQSGTSSITVTPLDGSTQTVGFSCGAPQAKITCSFMPAQVILDGTHASSTTVTILTTANGKAAATLPMPLFPEPPGWQRLWGIFAAMLALLAIGLFARLLTDSPQHWRRLACSAALLVLIATALGACSGQSNSSTTGTPAGTYTITITAAATSGGTSHPAAVSVTVH